VEPLHASKTVRDSSVRPHLINYFEEIGWVDPFSDAKNNLKEPSRNITLLQFDIPAYDQSKFVESYPPLIIYLPN